LSFRNNGTVIGGFSFYGSKIEAYAGTGTLLATGTTTLSPSSTYNVEIRYKVADSPDGIIQVKLNGSEYEINFSGDTLVVTLLPLMN